MMFGHFRTLLVTSLSASVCITVYFIVFYDHPTLRIIPQPARIPRPLDDLPIYVLTLPHRKDRREQMEVLRTALELNWTYINATDSTDPLVQEIEEKVHRNRALATHATFKWPDGEDTLESVSFSGSGTGDTVQILSKDREPLTCAKENNTIPPYSPSLPNHLLLTPARIACWHSHASLIVQLARSDSAGIVLEDDVDMERDIGERIGSIWSSLPVDWDIVFLGHCWSDESVHAPLPLPLKKQLLTRLHPSNAPRCTHAYALSPSGAKTITHHLNYPLFAYSRAIDQAFSWLVQSKRLKAYSVVPSVVVQRKIGSSDISSEAGDWRDELIHGVFPDEHETLYY